MAPVGLVLAGGRATRLGGGDKPLLTCGGATLLAQVERRLAPQCAGLVLSANGDPARFAPWAWPIVADHAADAGCGPLAGLLAGLDWIAAHHSDADTVLSLPGDTPFAPPDLVERLSAARPAGAVAVARSAGREHPLAALWPLALRHGLAGMLREEGVRRVRDVLRRSALHVVDWPDSPIDPFFNVNTPADLAAADAWLASG